MRSAVRIKVAPAYNQARGTRNRVTATRIGHIYGAMALNRQQIFILSALGVATAIGISAGYGNRPMPPLLQSLPKSLPEANTAFQQRIAQAFPPGSEARALTRQLDDNGFGPPATSAEPGLTRVFERPGYVCTLRAQVNWREDGAGKLVETGATFGAVCL